MNQMITGCDKLFRGEHPRLLELGLFQDGGQKFSNLPKNYILFRWLVMQYACLNENNKKWEENIVFQKCLIPSREDKETKQTKLYT